MLNNSNNLLTNQKKIREEGDFRKYLLTNLTFQKGRIFTFYFCWFKLLIIK
jgi:hypothetical protein